MDRIVLSTEIVLDIAAAIKKLPALAGSSLDKVCFYKENGMAGAVFTDGHMMVNAYQKEQPQYPNWQEVYQSVADQEYLFTFLPSGLKESVKGMKGDVTLTWEKDSKACRLECAGRTALLPITFEDPPTAGSVIFSGPAIQGIFSMPCFTKTDFKCVLSRRHYEPVANEEAPEPSEIPYYFTYGKRDIVLMPMK